MDCSKVILKKGSTGNDVLTLQKRLASLKDPQTGKVYYPYKIDGSYGNYTVIAVKAYQYDKKLVVDGWIGKQTCSSLGLSTIVPVVQVISDTLKPYLLPTKNCQSDDPIIVNKVKEIIGNSTDPLEKAVKIYNWVLKFTNYVHYFNTKYGAVKMLQVLNGNCTDMAHLLVAMNRAAGIPARYVNVQAIFSSGKLGHTIVQVYVNLKWYTEDATDNDNAFNVITNWTIQKGTAYKYYRELPY